MYVLSIIRRISSRADTKGTSDDVAQPQDPTPDDLRRGQAGGRLAVAGFTRAAESGGVSDKRREAVQAAISELGYRPSRAATTLASSRTKSIGLVIDDYRNLWFVDLLRGMESALTEHGYQVMLADSRPGRTASRKLPTGCLPCTLTGW